MSGVLDDLALVDQIPLYAIPDEAPFTLDQHLAFNRITELVPTMLAALAVAEAVLERQSGPAVQAALKRVRDARAGQIRCKQ